MKKLFAVLTIVACVFVPSTINASETYMEYCETIGNAYGISPELLQAVVLVESNGNPNIVSNAGAVGLCQIIPRWHKERMQRLGVSDLMEPYSNILVCADFINELRFKYNDLYTVLNYYNSGRVNYNATDYSIKVTEKAFELEEINGKHSYTK